MEDEPFLKKKMIENIEDTNALLLRVGLRYGSSPIKTTVESSQG